MFLYISNFNFVSRFCGIIYYFTMDSNTGATKKNILLNILWNFGVIKSKRRLNTVVFLIQCKLKERDNNPLDYKFYDTITGPYSEELMDDIESLANAGFINGSNKTNEGLFTHHYILTDFGKTAFEWTIKKSMPLEIQDAIRDNSQKYKELSWYDTLNDSKAEGCAKFLSKDTLSIFEEI